MSTKKTATQIIPFIGDPVAQVATPDLWNKYFIAKNIDAMCVPFHLKPAGLSQFVEWIRHTENIPGFLSTIPHKSDLVEMCNICTKEVEILGVANTVRKNKDGSLEGAMFDGIGMVSAIKAAGADFHTASVLIIGAGAAGGAIAYEALQSGAKSVVLTDFHKETAINLVEKLRSIFPNQSIQTVESEQPSYDVIVNASPLGGDPDDALPSELNVATPNAVIADAVTEPNETSFLKTAKENGFKTISGKEMAAAQAFYMKKFLGINTN